MSFFVAITYHGQQITWYFSDFGNKQAIQQLWGPLTAKISNDGPSIAMVL